MDSINEISYYLKCQTLSNTSQMTFLANVNSRSLYAIARPSVVCLSVVYRL